MDKQLSTQLISAVYWCPSSISFSLFTTNSLSIYYSFLCKIPIISSSFFSFSLSHDMVWMPEFTFYLEAFVSQDWLCILLRKDILKFFFNYVGYLSRGPVANVQEQRHFCYFMLKVSCYPRYAVTFKSVLIIHTRAENWSSP